jgi:hypothetical protein
MAKAKATPGLPASSRMKMPMAADKPAIKNALKGPSKAAGVKSVKTAIKKK